MRLKCMMSHLAISLGGEIGSQGWDGGRWESSPKGWKQHDDVWFGHGQAPPQVWFPALCYGSKRFRRVEPPWTHDKLPYDPCSLRSSVVWGFSVSMNHPDHIWNNPMKKPLIRTGHVNHFSCFMHRPRKQSSRLVWLLIPESFQLDQVSTNKLIQHLLMSGRG